MYKVLLDSEFILGGGGGGVRSFAKEVAFDKESSVMCKGPVNKGKTYPKTLHRAETALF